MDIDMDVFHGELRRRLRHVESAREALWRAGVYDSLPQVAGLMAGKDVLVTGASGFLGRVLLEKLLRSVPDVGTVFLLLRPKRGVPAHQRVNDIVDAPLFDQLIREQPSALRKLAVVAGDCSELRLGLSDEDRAMLRDRVAFVFHGAASVRFDDPVQKAVLLNTRGAREVVELCSGMPRLEALVHISTAYTNINRMPVEEKLYPSHLDWKLVIEAVSNADAAAAQALDLLGPKLLTFHPNSYTFSKELAEHVMSEAAKALPVIIVRPSVVVGAAKEPLPGWLDTINSPAALWAAGNMGVFRTSRLFADEIAQDYVPVDMVAKAIIMAGYVRATKQPLAEDGDDVRDAPVVNVCISDVHSVPGRLIHDTFVKIAREAVPTVSAIRYPVIYTTTNWYLCSLIHIFYHLMFGVAMDTALRLANQKPRLMKVYRKLAVATEALAPFVHLRINFNTANFWKLQLLMHPNDLKDFDFDLDSFDPRVDSLNQMKGILEYAFKEKFDREKGLQHINRLYWLEAAFYVFLFFIVLYYLGPAVFIKMKTS